MGGRGIGQLQPVHGPRRLRAVRGALAVEIGHEHQPAGAPRARSERPAGPTPNKREMASRTRAPFRVQARGRKRPVASAKPAIMPVGSATGLSTTAATTPDVPMETTTSPGPAPTPRAAAALSPVPGPRSTPDGVLPAEPAGARTRGT